MNYYEQTIQADARRQQLAAEAAQWQQIYPDSAPIYAALLARAGDMLVGAGTLLQERFGQQPEAAAVGIAATGEHAAVTR